MKVLSCLLVIISSLFSFGCSKAETAVSKDQAEIDKVYKTKPDGEIVFNDQSLAQTDDSSRTSSQNTTQVARDGSRVTTMFDGHGNKTEMRFFNNDPLLQTIMIRTSAKGETQVSVYGQNGRVRQLPDNMLGKAMSASASELATAAGIYEGRSETPTPTVVPNQPPLKPMPSSNFPVQKPQAETVPAETPAAETPKPSVEPTAVPKQTVENPPSKNQSEKQN